MPLMPAGSRAPSHRQAPVTCHLSPSTSPACCPLPPLPAVKEVRNSAFVSTLKERMSQLRHSKLYKASKKEVLRVRAVNRNPMKVGAGAGP